MSTPDAHGWYTMDSAPKDGTEILACSTHEAMGGNFQQVVYWDTTNDPAYGWWIVDAKVARHVNAFTHWRPRPLPPIPTSEDSK